MQTRTPTFDYLRSVLGIRSVLRSEQSVTLAADAPSEHIQRSSLTSAEPRSAPRAESPFQSFGPPTAPFGFILSSSLPTDERQAQEGNWRHVMKASDAAQLEKMILATGHSPEHIRLIFLQESQIQLIEQKSLTDLFGATHRWIVMGPLAVSVLWQSRPITTVRGQVLTKGSTYLWPTWGIWEMNTNPALKREVWADMKRAFQGFIIEAPGPAAAPSPSPSTSIPRGNKR